MLAGIEKVAPTLEDAACILRVLARSATGQEMSAYTTFSAGPRRAGDADGPEAFHVVLVDNGRSALLGSPTEDILRCIRCGCCLNACPVYGKVGGHAYGSAYPGPVGAVLTPSLAGLEETRHLPNASSLCGRCEEVCPMRIPDPGDAAPSPRAGGQGGPRPGGGQARPGPVERAGAPPPALPPSQRPRRRRHGRAGPAARALPPPAAGGGVDAGPRPRRAAGPELPGALGAGRTAVNARQAILGRVRRGLGRAGGTADERAREAVAQRLACRPRGPLPAALNRSRAALVDRFASKARAVDATVAFVAGDEAAPGAVAAYLRSRNLPAEAARAPHPDLDAMDWAGAALTVRRRAPGPADRVGVNRAFAAAAETGTLAMASGPDSPATMNFLPETHIAVIRESEIAAGLEEVWDRLRGAGRGGGEGLPRTLNLITGTSRTGDIEQTLQTGVHGPRRLHIVVVREGLRP